MRGFNRGKQLAGFTLQCYGDDVYLFQSDAYDPAFDTAHIAAVDAADMGEIFLGNAQAIALLSDVFAKELSQFVHSGYLALQGIHFHFLEDWGATDYNPHFPLYPLCMTHNRDTILFGILQDQKDRHLTVTSVRNEILRRDKSIMLDKVVLRRWVNGKFLTLVRRGVLAKHRNERGKAYFVVLKDGVGMQPEARLRRGQTPPVRPRASDPAPLPYGQLRKELGEYRLKAISQMGEIEEYKRISETYPDLRLLATEKFESAVDENSRLLGRIRALEQLLAGRVTL